MTVSDEVFFNPLEPGYMADPYPHFAEMRNLLPVQQTLAGPWAIFRYDDCFRLLRDPKLSVDEANASDDDNERQQMFDELFPDAELRGDTSMLNTDPPDHTRLRRLVSKAFTPRVIEALRPRVQELVDVALDEIADAGTGDVVGQLAFPLPFDVISEMLGMPEADKVQIRDWSSAMVKTLDPILSEDDARAAIEAGVKMGDQIDSVIAWKRANPADDLLTALIDANEDGDHLSDEELVDQVVLLFIAGHETTVNLIGTGIYELLRNPDQLGLWRDDPSLDANAVDELLRHVSPVQFSRRIATSDISYGDRTIPKGSFVLAGLASSNHDPDMWGPTADQLDLHRANAGQHISFGSGAHYCLGASLAKLEAQVACGSFIRRFPHAEVVGTPTWNGRINLRGLDQLIVKV